MKIEIDLPLCEGHAQCEIIAPDYFEVRDDGLAYLLKDTVEPGDVDLLNSVVQRCPTAAIRLRSTEADPQ
ncbi:ferredoxin [Mycobacterium deserti]|uniref:Ferredoxin n=1 Tax=Mycobacterium deserti TaxID=2978347 RepID=A0ABT2MHW1_9MYCO|nr:ferredoxin [Mycobacterium deserti]MCT7661865.1 ferredoxin [Mycobacterium deserti]